MYMYDKMSRETVFKLRDYCNDDDCSTLLDSTNHILIVESVDGTRRQLSVKQLEIFLQHAAAYEHIGEALNAVFKYRLLTQK